MNPVARFSLVLLILPIACGQPAGSDDLSVREDFVGDTLVLTSVGAPPVDTVTHIDIVWRSEGLERPQSMVAAEGGLFVGDRRGVHFIALPDHTTWTRNRAGDGPGEFRSVGAVGVFGPDTLAVHDERLMRVSYWSTSGEFLGSRQITPSVPYVNSIRDGASLVRAGTGLLWARTENIYMTRPTRTALVWHDLETDTVQIVGSWDDIQWRDLGSGFVGQEELFPARVSLAISRMGRIAQGNTLDYCITLWGQHDTPRRACRDWRRAPVGGAIRSPDPELVPEGQREVLQAQWRVQKVGDQMPSFDRIRFGEDEELWVRTLGSEMSDVHPFILGRRPELGPPYRSWDVFSAEGRLERTVWLPSLFDPRVMMREELYGFYELPTGEIVIGRAEAPFPRRTGR